MNSAERAELVSSGMHCHISVCLSVCLPLLLLSSDQQPLSSAADHASTTSFLSIISHPSSPRWIRLHNNSHQKTVSEEGRAVARALLGLAVRSDAEEGAVREGEDVHGLQAVEHGGGELRHARGVEMTPLDQLRLAVHLEQVDGLAARVEPHLAHHLD